MAIYAQSLPSCTFLIEHGILKNYKETDRKADFLYRTSFERNPDPAFLRGLASKLGASEQEIEAAEKFKRALKQYDIDLIAEYCKANVATFSQDTLASAWEVAVYRQNLPLCAFLIHHGVLEGIALKKADILYKINPSVDPNPVFIRGLADKLGISEQEFQDREKFLMAFKKGDIGLISKYCEAKDPASGKGDLATALSESIYRQNLPLCSFLIDHGALEGYAKSFKKTDLLYKFDLKRDHDPAFKQGLAKALGISESGPEFQDSEKFRKTVKAGDVGTIMRYNKEKGINFGVIMLAEALDVAIYNQDLPLCVRVQYTGCTRIPR
jgi:hypothetical protein